MDAGSDRAEDPDVPGLLALERAQHRAPQHFHLPLPDIGHLGELVERRGREVLDAVARGVAVPEDALPRFPRAPRWDKDPEFDARVGALKEVRDAVAAKLDLDPGVLASRGRLEAIARAKPAMLDALAEVPDVRKWQVEVLGSAMLRALKG